MKSDILRRSSKGNNHGNCYKLGFILSIVDDIEHGRISQAACRRKHGILGHSTVRRWLDKYSKLDWSMRKDY